MIGPVSHSTPPLPLLITGIAGVAGYNAFHYFRRRFGEQVIGIRQSSMWPLVGAWPGARALSRRIQDAWVAFARGDAPEHDAIRHWPKHAGDSPVSLRLDHEDRLAEGLDDEALSALDADTAGPTASPAPRA